MVCGPRHEKNLGVKGLNPEVFCHLKLSLHEHLLLLCLVLPYKLLCSMYLTLLLLVFAMTGLNFCLHYCHEFFDTLSLLCHHFVCIHGSSSNLVLDVVWCDGRKGFILLIITWSSKPASGDFNAVPLMVSVAHSLPCCLWSLLVNLPLLIPRPLPGVKIQPVNPAGKVDLLLTTSLSKTSTFSSSLKLDARW